MSSIHYDIAIIGGSLTARIAAALFTKHGIKVLCLWDNESQAPAWFHSSVFLEKLLGILGGRSCFVAPHPIQVISQKSRLTLSQDLSLDDELQREFGRQAMAVLTWLKELYKHGSQLEDLFWDNGGLPWPTLTSAAKFKMLCMRRKTNLASLEVPVIERLRELKGPAREFVIDLLQGLSLLRIEHLSYARAAMLWAQAIRPENLKEPDFSNMLNKRFAQFHGAKAELEELERLEFNGSSWTGGRFKTGGHFTATTFLLGDSQCLGLFKAVSKDNALCPYAPKALRTSDLSGQTSTLLGTRVICGGELPLCMAIDAKGEKSQGLVLSSPDNDETNIRKQLEPILPFAKYQMTEVDSGTSSVSGQQKHLSALPIRIQSNLYCADRSALLPEMGAAGAALLAWTLFNNLSGKGPREKT